jgi:para-nitrobenzyl esterase
MVAGCAHGGTAALDVPADPAVVQTTAGAVRGTVAADHRQFAGIPYAAPPVGPLRWQPPAPAPAWPGLRDATRPGPRCIQDSATDVDRRRTSEDCLTLNVWTPPPAHELKPVMVWIHGGGFLNGSGDIYNARRLASRGDIVVVTINYRLGALGFLAHPSLGPAGDVGNYGFADQQAALRWVHDNIEKFGGDPGKVTIAGESAGGMSVCDHLVAPGSVGLFRSAIIQSGPCQAQFDADTAQKVSRDYAAEAGCADPATAAECLRALPADRLQKSVFFGRIGTERLSGPVTGTATLPVDPITGFAQGRAADASVLIGITADEFNVFTALQYIRGRPFDADHYPELLTEAFGPYAGVIAQHYPPQRFGGSVALAYSHAATDGVFACPTAGMGAALARTQSVYGYEFNDANAPSPEPLRGAPFPVAAGHSMELRYLFDIGDAAALKPAQQRLADQMVDYWAEFVRSGSPGSDWPQLTNGDSHRRMLLQPDDNHVITTFEQAHDCGFWTNLKG